MTGATSAEGSSAHEVADPLLLGEEHRDPIVSGAPPVAFSTPVVLDLTGTQPEVLVIRPTIYSQLLKRSLDIIGALVLLGLTWPFIACAAGATFFSLGQPVLFRQRRVGRYGQDFEIMKIRTMRAHPVGQANNAGAAPGAANPLAHKNASDPRHTRLGRLLRRWSIDELPQLVNVLRGEMSLVGPRPELASVVDFLGLRDHPRHIVRPGMTGPWQVSEARLQPLYHGMQMDAEYVRTITLRGDLAIIGRTYGAVLKGHGR